MTSSEKLRFLLVRQFVYFGASIGLLALMVVDTQVGLLVGSLVGVAFIRFIMPRWERKLRDTEVRLSLRQKHVYFGVGMIYFLGVFGALFAWAVRHSSPPAWAGAGLGFTVLLVALYAAVDLTYGGGSKV